jgi:hypothetical protein
MPKKKATEQQPARDKVLSKEQQEKLLTQATTIIRAYKDHQDKVYLKDFRDYRLLAAGKMPIGVEERLKKEKYKKMAKLIPRLVADHCEDKVGMVMNETVNRPEPFRFQGINTDDQINAENARKLVMHGWNHVAPGYAGAKAEFRLTVRDAAVLGGGWLERSHWIDRRLRVQYGGNASYTSRDFDVIYVGPRWKYIRSEMMYPQPKPPEMRFETATGFVKLLTVPISFIRKEGLRGGLYAKYAKNIRNIKKDDYKSDAETQYATSSDHKEETAADFTTDFNVLIAEWWTSMLDIFGNDLPVWHVTTIANWEQNPQVLRCDIDPLGNGRHPFLFVRLFDYSEPRLYGPSIPERLYQYFLEGFYKRNQRINLLNIAIRRAGMLIGPRASFPPDFIEAEGDKIVFAAGSGKDVQSLPIELGAYQHLMAEEQKTERDAERTSATNPVQMGQTPTRREAATTTAILDQNATERTRGPVAMVEDTMIRPAAQDSHEHYLIFVPEPFIGRVLGPDRSPQFFRFSRADILGHFDAYCQGSSEVTPKAIRLANMNAMAQTYAGLPVQLDWNEFAREHFKVAEIPNIDHIVIMPSNTQAEIERENGALSNGETWIPLPHEDHQAHIAGHQQYAMNMITTGQHQGIEAKEIMRTPGFQMLQQHSQMHYQMLMQKQGVMSQSKQQASFGQMSDLLDRLGSDNMARIGMAG